MKFTQRITWSIGLSRGNVIYPLSEAIEAVRVALAARGFDGFTVQHGTGYSATFPSHVLYTPHSPSGIRTKRNVKVFTIASFDEVMRYPETSEDGTDADGNTRVVILGNISRSLNLLGAFVKCW